MAPPISSCCLLRSKAGATSKSQIAIPPWITLASRKTWPTSTSRTPRPSFWSRTISASTARLHSTKPFRPSKPGAWSSASNGTTLQNTAAGSIWPSSELGVLTSQCLDRRIPNKQILIDEIAAWEHDRNANHSSTSLPPLKERALAIAEKALGPEHRGTAATLNNLALLMHDQGDLGRARQLYERALAIAEKALGPEHRHTNPTRRNLSSP